MALNLQKQKANNMRKILLKQSKQWLEANQHFAEDEKTSVKAVVKGIRLQHVQLAIWCHENRGIHLHTYNFHDIITNYDTQNELYKIKNAPQLEDKEIVFVTVIDEAPDYCKDGTIRPADFQAYFGRGEVTEEPSFIPTGRRS